MKIRLHYFLLFFTITISAQTPADVDLVVGSGFVGFSTVQAIVEQPDGKIVVGGHQEAGMQGMDSEARLARFNSDGSRDTSFEAFPLTDSGFIFDIAIQSDGKILVAGNFAMMDGEYVGSFIRLNTDGSRDSSFLPASGGVRSIALQPDGKIVIAGLFSIYVNEHVQRFVARLNADGTLDSTFDFGFYGFEMQGGGPEKVAIQADGKILVGGSFSTFNNEPQGKLIRFNADGTKDTAFNIGTGVTDSGYVGEIVLQSDGKILIGGGFGSWSGQPFGRLCRLNNDGSLDASFVLGVEGFFVRNLALQTDGKMVAIGGFTLNNTMPPMVRLNSDGSLDGTFIAQPDNIPECLTLQTDGKVLIGGTIANVGGISKKGFARLNTNGALDTSFSLSTGLNDQVFTIALQTDGKTLIGGDFTTFDGLSQNKLIRLDDTEGKDVSFNIGTGFNSSVRKIAAQSDGKILVGGNFTAFNGETANALIRLNSDGTRDASFSTGSGFDDYVKTIILQPDGKILIGGNFTQFNDQQQNYLIRLNADGTKDSGFSVASAFNDRITSLALQPDGRIIVGGNFTTFNGSDQKCLIRLNADGTKDTAFEIGTGFSAFNSSDVIRDIELLPDGKMYIASLPSSYNGNPIGRPIRLNADGSVDGSFTQGAIINSSESIDAIAIQQDGKIIAGGSFYSVNNLANIRRRIMRINTDGTLDTTFDANSGQTQGVSVGFHEGTCHDIVIQSDNKIWVGGSFFTYKGVSSFSAIRLVGDAILSIDDFEPVQNKILVYPNPVKDVLYFKSAFKTVQITEITGKTLAWLENTNQVDFSNYPEGLYLLTIEQENGSIETKKIVKQ